MSRKRNGEVFFNKKKQWEKQNGKCYICDKMMNKKFEGISTSDITHIERQSFPTWDHKIPLSRGGENNRTNVELACYQCNYFKGSLTIEEYKEYQTLIEQHTIDENSRLEELNYLKSTGKHTKNEFLNVERKIRKRGKHKCKRTRTFYGTENILWNNYHYTACCRYFPVGNWGYRILQSAWFVLCTSDYQEKAFENYKQVEFSYIQQQRT